MTTIDSSSSNRIEIVEWGVNQWKQCEDDSFENKDEDKIKTEERQ